MEPTYEYRALLDDEPVLHIFAPSSDPAVNAAWRLAHSRGRALGKVLVERRSAEGVWTFAHESTRRYGGQARPA